MTLNTTDIKEGAFVWWTVDSDYGSSWDCPGRIVDIQEGSLFKILTYDTMKTTGAFHIASLPNRPGLRTCEKYEVISYLIEKQSKQRQDALKYEAKARSATVIAAGIEALIQELS